MLLLPKAVAKAEAEAALERDVVLPLAKVGRIERAAVAPGVIEGRGDVQHHVGFVFEERFLGSHLVVEVGRAPALQVGRAQRAVQKTLEHEAFGQLVGGIEVEPGRETPALDAQRRTAAHDVLHIGAAADVPALGRLGRAVEVELVIGVGGHVGIGLGRDAGGRVGNARIGRQPPHRFDGIVGPPHRGRDIERTGLAVGIKAQLVGIRQLGVEGGIAEYDTQRVAPVHKGVEVVDVRPGDAAAVGQAEAVVVAERVLRVAVGQ